MKMKLYIYHIFLINITLSFRFVWSEEEHIGGFNSFKRKLEELTGFNYDNNDIHNYDNTVLQKNLENCDKSSIMVNDYLIRFINVFLRKSKLNEKNEFDNEVNVKFEVSLTQKDIELLKNLSEGSESLCMIYNLSDLDDIFLNMKVNDVSESHNEINIIENINILFDKIVNSDFLINGIPASSTLLQVFLLLTISYFCFFGYHKCLILVLFIAINWVILDHGIQDYHNLIMEFEREIMNPPLDCDSPQLGWFGYFKTIVTVPNCQQYKEQVKKRISMLECILESYGKYFIKTFGVIGSICNEISEKLTMSLPWMFRSFFQSILSLLILFTIVGVIFYSCFGSYFRMSFLGFAVESNKDNYVKFSKESLKKKVTLPKLGLSKIKYIKSK